MNRATTRCAAPAACAAGALVVAALAAGCGALDTGQRSAAASGCPSPASLAGRYQGGIAGATGVMVPISVGTTATFTLRAKRGSGDSLVVTGGRLTGNILGTPLDMTIEPGLGEARCGAFHMAIPDETLPFSGILTGTITGGATPVLAGSWRGHFIGGDRTDEPAGVGRGTFRLTRSGP